jgi:hypothetical protein
MFCYYDFRSCFVSVVFSVFSLIFFIVIFLTKKMHVTFVIHYFAYSIEYCVDVSNATEA